MKKWIFLLSILMTAHGAHAGKIQNEDIKSLSELISAGGTMSQLPNDTKIYVTANGINSQLSTAISSGLIGGGGGAAGINLLSDPGFEITGSLSSYWTATGGTLTQITSGSNLLVGVGSAAYQATGSGQIMRSNAYAVPNGLKGASCTASMMYKGADENLFFTVSDGTNTLASQQLVPTTGPRQVQVYFTCPSSGSLRAQVVSIASSAIMAMDQMFLGQSATPPQVSQATFYGGVTLQSDCALSTTSGTFTDLTESGSSCTSYTLNGNASAWSHSDGMVTFNNMPPGDYQVAFNGMCWSPNGVPPVGQLNIIDDASATPVILRFDGLQNNASLGSETPCYMTAPFHYTTGGTHTFKLHGLSGYPGVQPFGWTSNAGETITVYRYPTQQEQLVAADTINWVVDAYTYGTNVSLPSSGSSGGTVILDTSNVTSVVPQASNTLPLQQPCEGFASNGLDCSTTGSSSAIPGIVFDLPAAGSVKICLSGTVAMGGTSISAQENFSVMETNNDDDVPIQQLNLGTSVGFQGTVASIAQQFGSCGVMNFQTAGRKTLKVFYAYGLSGTFSQHLLTYDATLGRVLRWSITPVTQSVPAPVFLPPAAFRVGDGVSGSPPPDASIVTAVWTSLGSFGFDTHGKYNTSNGHYTIPVAGLWHFDCSLNMSQNAGTDYQYDVYLIKAGGAGIFSMGQVFYDSAATAVRGRIVKTSNDIMLNVGDEIYCAGSINIAGTWIGDYATNYFEGHLIH